QVDGAAFAAHWAEQLSRAADPDAALDQLHVADLYLAFACAAGDASALRAFAAQLASAGAAVRGVDASPAFVDEVLQRLQTRVLVAEAGSAPRILEDAGRGPLENWLRAGAPPPGPQGPPGARRAPGPQCSPGCSAWT